MWNLREKWSLSAASIRATTKLFSAFYYVRLAVTTTSLMEVLKSRAEEKQRTTERTLEQLLYYCTTKRLA